MGTTLVYKFVHTSNIFVFMASFVLGSVFCVSAEPELRLKYRDMRVIDQRIHADIESAGILIQDQIVTDYITGHLLNLVDSTFQRKASLNVKLLNTSHFNAFSLSDGTIYISIALLGLIDNEAQLAFLLAHELAHIERDHHRKLKYETHEQALEAARHQIAGSIFGLSFPDLQGFQSALCGFSRNQESEADRIAVRKIASRRYNVMAGIKLFKTMHQWLKYVEKRIDPKFATHHLLDRRYFYSQNYAKVLTKNKKGGSVGTQKYNKAIAPYLSRIAKLLGMSNSVHGLYAMTLRKLSYNKDYAGWNYLQGKLVEKFWPVDSFAIGYSALKRAHALDSAQTIVLRDIGFLYLKNNVLDSAQYFLNSYLRETPRARDRSIIRFYLDNLNE